MKVSRSLGKTAKSWGSVGKVSPVPLVEFVPNPGELFLLLQPTFLFATLRMLLKRREGGGQHLGVWFLGALCNGERTGSSPETWVQPEQQFKVMNIGNLQGVEPRSLQFRPCYGKQPGRKEFSVLKSSSTHI